MLESNTVLQDRYLIERELGRGGMGAVYLATDRRFGATVALKQTLVTGEVLAKAFEREARLLNKLRHAALPVVIDYFTQTEGQFLVMQFIPGEDFGALLAARAGAPFPVADVLRWTDDLLDALDYLHTQDPPVVHRDIKPQNLKITPRGEIVLLDFGLAKGAALDIGSPGTTGTSVFGYTPHYAPFEQVKGAGTDARSDLFSLAATVYHMLTGLVPPDAMTRAEAAMLRKPDPLVSVREANPEVPPAVAAVLTKALSMDRDERYPSAIDMRAALRAAERDAGFEVPDSTTRAAGVPAVAPSHVPDATVTAGSERDAAAPTSADAPARPTAVVRPRRWPAIATVAGLVLVAAVAVAIWAFAWRAPAPTDPNLITTAPALSTFAYEVLTLAPDGAVAERKQLLGQSYFVDLGGNVSMEMVRVPAGSYERGSADAEVGRFTDEGPVQRVNVQEFYLGRYEVTQAQWRAVAALPKVAIELPPSPSEFTGDDLPVENVAWDQTREFCARVSARVHRVYRLPSESEWEYACRAGTTTEFACGTTISTDVANYDGTVAFGAGPASSSRGKTVPVGSLPSANPFGLSDMHGNVWEWCFGQYHDTWTGSPTDGSSWLEGGDNRLRACKGGAWSSLAADCRSANRFGLDVYDSPRAIGFRAFMRVGPGDAWAK